MVILSCNCHIMWGKFTQYSLNQFGGIPTTSVCLLGHPSSYCYSYHCNCQSAITSHWGQDRGAQGEAGVGGEAGHEEAGGGEPRVDPNQTICEGRSLQLFPLNHSLLARGVKGGWKRKGGAAKWRFHEACYINIWLRISPGSLG